MSTFDARVALERTPPPSCSSSTPPYQPYESRIRNWRQYASSLIGSSELVVLAACMNKLSPPAAFYAAAITALRQDEESEVVVLANPEAIMVAHALSRLPNGKLVLRRVLS